MFSVPAAAQFGAPLLAMALAGAATDASASTTPGVGPNYTFPDGSKGFAFMTTGGRLNPEVLVDFNPQPEPPGIWFGAQFGYPAAGDPGVTFALTENERPLTLSLAPVPEVPAWTLMIIGVGGVGALARSRTQTATARVGRPTSYSRL